MRKSNPSEQTGSLVFVPAKFYRLQKKCLPLCWALSSHWGEMSIPRVCFSSSLWASNTHEGIYAMGRSFSLLTTERVEGISVMDEL